MASVRKQPQRACIGCGQMKDKKELIRVLRTPEGSLHWMLPAGRMAGALIFAAAQSAWNGQ